MTMNLDNHWVPLKCQEGTPLCRLYPGLLWFFSLLSLTLALTCSARQHKRRSSSWHKSELLVSVLGTLQTFLLSLTVNSGTPPFCLHPSLTTRSLSTSLCSNGFRWQDCSPALAFVTFLRSLLYNQTHGRLSLPSYQEVSLSPSLSVSVCLPVCLFLPPSSPSWLDSFSIDYYLTYFLSYSFFTPH